jgi:hypothetical protein
MSNDDHAPALAAFAAELRAKAGSDAYYIFWFSGGARGGSATPGRERLLIGFPTPDAALAFAQRSVRRDGEERPRLRRLTLAQLLAAVLREPAIAALLLASESAGEPLPGRLPHGLRLDRAELLSRLERPPSAT